MKARKTRSMAPTLAAIFSPCQVPFEMESRAFSPTAPLPAITSSCTFSCCGYNILDMTTAPGAAITEAVRRCLAKSSLCAGSSPPRNPMYTAITPAAMVPMPATMMVMISERVIFSRYPFTMSGASSWPRKIFPATVRLSAPERLNALVNGQARAFTIF